MCTVGDKYTKAKAGGQRGQAPDRSGEHRDRDEYFMRMALNLAARARGRTSPNPMVGAVIVKDGLVLGSGFHSAAGRPHAEVEALNDAASSGRDVGGATLYVTLEPCCHYGRTPPCTDAIIKSGIARVVAAMQDPNPLVSGKGFSALKSAGMTVDVGVCGSEALALNEVYVKYITTRRPFVLLKCAMSLDGKIRTALGESKYITSEESRRKVHSLRNEMDAVMVGVGTVIADDPLLTVRLTDDTSDTYKRNPARIIVDSHLRLPLRSKILGVAPGVDDSGGFAENGGVYSRTNGDPGFRTNGGIDPRTRGVAAYPQAYGGKRPRTIIATLEDETTPRAQALKEKGAEIWTLPEREGRVDLMTLAEKCGASGITSILLEGGPTLAAAALRAGIIDKVLFFYAPVILGGATAPGPVGGEGVSRLRDAARLDRVEVGRCGPDVWISGYVGMNR